MSLDKSLNQILIIDFGSQFTQLIARRIRELGVFCEIVSHKKIKNKDIISSIKGIILSINSRLIILSNLTIASKWSIIMILSFSVKLIYKLLYATKIKFQAWF